MKVIFVIGLPASGKSTLISKLRGPNDIVLDDFTTPDLIRSSLSNNPGVLYISDPQFCKEDVLNKAKIIVSEYTDNIEYIYFENNPEACIHNSHLRINKYVDPTIKYLSKVYLVPKNIVAINVKEF
jgi:predicted ATPase